MLKTEDNELLVRVGPQTAMGDLMRMYWLPFLLSGDGPVDGQPYRVRLLGEDLVAFRDSEGRVGLVRTAVGFRHHVGRPPEGARHIAPLHHNLVRGSCRPHLFVQLVTPG